MPNAVFFVSFRSVMNHYADIVLPLAQPTYTYAVPEDMSLRVGQAVAVQFGARGYYTGIVWRLHDEQPDFPRIKPIHHVVYEEPLVSPTAQRFWEWIADYYMATLGEVMRVALPQLMKPSGQSEEEFAEDVYRHRTETYYRLSDAVQDEDRLNEAFEKLTRRAPRQYAALLELASPETAGRNAQGELPRRLLSANIATLRELEHKGLITSEERPRTMEKGQLVFRLPELSDHQQMALDDLLAGFSAGKRAALLQGVTGSGKTEIYIHLIARTLSAGGDVLLLVPEIALTAQLIERMECIFGSRVTAYHSKLSAQKRTETYLRLNRSEGGEFVVGARSALFLPLKHLQLVIVDEEHDASYKQTDPAPRYQGRDAAVMLAHLCGGQTLLGSATPSLESWINARSGKYAYASLTERYGSGRLPRIIISDTLRAARRGERKAHFNKTLLDKIEERISRHEQVMLFQNRRGFSPYVACTDCGWTARCPECNVTLTYHKSGEKLVCHYCGYTAPVPQHCPACKVADLTPMGFGTEKVAEEIARLFPEARVERLDRDTVTSERAYNKIIGDFSRHEIDILVGTQMITKGFDFEGVSLVGILNADNLLHNPDFRASERAFQLMMQVAGRAGRRDDGGEVVIQTSEPTHPLLRQVVAGDYEAMAREQASERMNFFYPPYARLVRITLRHKNMDTLRGAVCDLASRLRKAFGRRVLGPMTPPVDRIRGEFLVDLLLKIEHGRSMQKAREILRRELQELMQTVEYKSVIVILDVDPQ